MFYEAPPQEFVRSPLHHSEAGNRQQETSGDRNHGRQEQGGDVADDETTNNKENVDSKCGLTLAPWT